MAGFSIDGGEVQDILISLVVVAVAFSIRYLHKGFLDMFFIVLIGVGTGFIIHELAHKFVAMQLGAYARYQMWMNGLGMTLVLSFLTGGRFVFAAPGAVYIYAPYLTRFQNGVISIAGPLTNLLLGIGFFAFSLFAPGDYLQALGASAASINFFLGFFNMLPIPPLDGSKVAGWNLLAWLALIIPLGLLVFIF